MSEQSPRQGHIYIVDLLIDQIRAWDNALFRGYLGLLPEDLQSEVRKALY